MKKKSLIERLSSGKGFYITAAVSLALIVAAIGFVYSSSLKLIEDLDVPTTVKESVNEQVQKNKKDVSDPRQSTSSGTSLSDEDKSTTHAAESTTQKVTSAAESTTATTSSTVNVSYIYPFGKNIGKEFSLTAVYDETMEDWRIHLAIDFLGEKGSDVVSIGDGKVTKVISDTSLGYIIEVDYGEFTARYCGIEQGTAVGIDDSVKKGELIGKLGDIPCESEQESHLHFETIKDGEAIDPLKALKK